MSVRNVLKMHLIDQDLGTPDYTVCGISWINRNVQASTSKNHTNCKRCLSYIKKRSSK